MEVMSKITSASAVTASAGESSVLDFLFNIVASSQTELLMFVVALLGYFALFMHRSPKNVQARCAKVQDTHEHECDEDFSAQPRTEDRTQQPCGDVEKALQDAFALGDYRSVLSCWHAAKNFDRMPSIPLSQVVESMQRTKKDTAFILRELRRFFKKYATECDMTIVNELLESLAKRLDSSLMEKIVEILESSGLKMDERSFETFLNMHFTMRSFQEVMALVSQMKSKMILFTTRSSIVVIKTALKMGIFEDAMQAFRDLRNTWTALDLGSTPSFAPTQIVTELVELACKDHRLGELIPEMGELTISESLVHTMLSECIRQKDVTLVCSVERLAREKEVRFTDATYSLLIKGMVADPFRVQALVDEACETGVQLTVEFSNSVLGFCSQTSNVQMAEKLYGYMQPKQVPILSSFIRFYAEIAQYEKACDVYECDLLPLLATFDDGSRCHGQRPRVDSRMERVLMNAAVKCGRGHLAQDLLEASPSDIAKHITMIQKCAAEGNLKGAVSIFESLGRSGVDMNAIIYNTVLDACVECRDLKAAEEWMEQTKKAGMADVVSFNTLIKAHLQTGAFTKARRLMIEMKQNGLQPNRVTFNELLNTVISKGGDSKRKQMWDMIEEMKAAEVKPNRVTASILLKSLNNSSVQSDILKTMDFIKTMDEPMDEVLLSSVVEACVRIGKPDLLESQLKELQNNGCAISGSHTYGSLIKAYGHARDTEGIWRCWKEMRSRHIRPTSITVGCMIEAIVSNGDTEGAYDLLHQMQDDEQCRGAINAVIYCSVLKGFAREKKMTRALTVYEEIRKKGIELSIVMYNTLIDSCARCGRMEHLEGILADMKALGVKPNVVTYSTMLKGHCQSGDIRKGFLILEQLRKEGSLKPDEIMYNSLLDGCARSNLVEEGLHLVEEMQTEGVPPSNFTLSILVKLLGRARRLEQAFVLVSEITKKYNFRANGHTYTNLIQSCVANQQLPRGIKLLEEMMHECIAPDTRTYAILVRTSISKGLFEQAAKLLKGALGLPGTVDYLQVPVATCNNLENSLVNEVLYGLAENGHAHDLAAPLLTSIKQSAQTSWVRIDAATQRKVMSPCLPSEGSEHRQAKGKGRGGWNRQ